ncbi:MAG TPA: AMP-binding protein [Verrucomicrobiae bacterium]|nr:AMP-binding protein [Verrucomicrobiae bacterium]
MITDLAGWRARLTPERPALFWRGRWLNYAELDQRASTLAARLHAEGVRRGDRVSILALNHLAHVDLLLAAPKLGFIFAPLNHRLSGAEQHAIGEALTPALVLHDRANLASAEGLGRRLLPLERYAEWLAKPAPAIASPALDEADTWMILLTGGSTGTPKGAQIPYRQVFGNAANTVLAWGLREDDCAIQATPAFHAAVNVLATPLWFAGGRVVWMENFEPGEYLELVAAQGASVLFMVPAMFQMLATHAEFGAADLSRVRFAITGGAPCPPPVCEVFAARGVRFKLGFGMTECGVNCFAIDVAEAARHPDSVGHPMPLLEAVIRDEHGAAVPAGTVGELTLRGPVVFSGYFGAPDATREMIRDGWLWTGDLARRDADGRHFICGRRKEMYISGGENVYPAEVEAALSQCRGVAECAVIGVPHPRWGETGLAAVVARAGARLDAETLRLELKQRLASYKLPGEFVFMDALPRTGAGKVAKVELRRLTHAQAIVAGGAAR